MKLKLTMYSLFITFALFISDLLMDIFITNTSEVSDEEIEKLKGDHIARINELKEYSLEALGLIEELKTNKPTEL